MSNNLTTRKWVIIPSCFITSVNFDDILQTNKNTLRYSLNNEKTFIKYDTSEQPNFLSSITCFCVDCGCTSGAWCTQENSVMEYNHSEMLTILGTTEWVDYTNL